MFLMAGNGGCAGKIAVDEFSMGCHFTMKKATTEYEMSCRVAQALYVMKGNVTADMVKAACENQLEE